MLIEQFYVFICHTPHTGINETNHSINFMCLSVTHHILVLMKHIIQSNKSSNQCSMMAWDSHANKLYKISSGSLPTNMIVG